MSTTQYIGARYVPIFGRVGEDSIDWDSTKPYEPLTIVLANGNSYTSRQFVPVGIDIGNNDYWALTGNYNAQIDAYRQNVENLSKSVSSMQETVDSQNAKIDENTESLSQAETNITALQTDVSSLQSTVSENTVDISANATAIATETARAKAAETENFENSRNPYKAWSGRKALIIGDSFSSHSDSQNKWPYYLSQSLGFTYKNYAVSGTGFIDPGSGSSPMKFSDQVAKAANDLSEQERKGIDYVFILGGYNDVSRSDANTTAMQTAANNVSVVVKNGFPNAQIICIPMNWGLDKFSSTARAYANAIMYGMTADDSAPVHMINYLWTWLLCSQSYFSTDSLHPNDNGYRQIAKFIQANLLGCQTIPRVMQQFRFESGFSYYEENDMPFIDGDLVTIPCTWINCSSPITTTTRIASTTNRMIPSGGQFGTVYKGNVPVGGWTLSVNGYVNVIPDSGVTITDGFYLGGIQYYAYGKVS